MLCFIYVQNFYSFLYDSGQIAVIGNPSCSLQNCQVVTFWFFTLFVVYVKYRLKRTFYACVFLYAPVFWHHANLTFFAVVIRLLWRAGKQLFWRGRHGGSFLGPILDWREIGIMRSPCALSDAGIRLLVRWTNCTFSGQNIVYRSWLITVNTLISIEEGLFEGTVGNVVISDVSLVIFLNQVVNILIS